MVNTGGALARLFRTVDRAFGYIVWYSAKRGYSLCLRSVHSGVRTFRRGFLPPAPPSVAGPATRIGRASFTLLTFPRGTMPGMFNWGVPKLMCALLFAGFSVEWLSRRFIYSTPDCRDTPYLCAPGGAGRKRSATSDERALSFVARRVPTLCSVWTPRAQGARRLYPLHGSMRMYPHPRSVPPSSGCTPSLGAGAP